MNADRHEVITEVLGLAQHYMRTVRTPEQEERFLRDYIEDLSEYPISAIKAGCKAWRHSEATRFPTPGQLLAKVGANLPRRQGATAETWRELSDGEYRALSLREKIRHHLISAAACRIKAGPMWASGRHLSAGEMGPVWRRWTDLAANHGREASRLRAKLTDAQGQPAGFAPADIPGMLGPKPSQNYPTTVRAPAPPTHGPTDATGLTREMRELMGIDGPGDSA